uniref:SCP domain-containing protein n=1 Tax=Panagrellus redivivus TaxID=6233 RepID=A0A7E4W9Z1_PANRE
MTGLLSTVVAVLVLAFLGTVTDSAYVCSSISPFVNQTTEQCMNKVETGSEMSNEERQSAVDAINMIRTCIANQYEFNSGKTKSANFRKIRYACDIEATLKFTCPAADEIFESDRRVFRKIVAWSSSSVFFGIVPFLPDVDIDEQTQKPKNPSDYEMDTMKFYLTGEAGAAEIGCYKRKCDDKAYLACSSHTDIDDWRPLYTAGNRCQSNVDCKDPEYPICDMELGLCQQGNLPYRCGQHQNPTVRIREEMCLDSVTTESNMSNAERQLIVDAMNLHRGFITNQCDAWGSGTPESANMLKVHYNCELEKQVKFECPEAGPENWKSDATVFRQIGDPNFIVFRTSIMWRLKPLMSDVKIDSNTQALLNATVSGSEFLSFALNNDVSEVGCYLKPCHDKEYIACTTGHPFDVTKPLYKRGNRCQKNADCIVAGYHICNMEFGLCDKGGCQKDADCTDAASPVCNLESRTCGPLTCKFSDSSLAVDACKDLRACTEATDKAEPEKQFCRSTVIIADRNNYNTFTVKGFGAAVGEKHLLASVSSKFTKYGTSELYVIVGGMTILRAADVLPTIYIGSFNLKAWQDLTLVKLAGASSFKFNDYLQVKQVGPGSQDKSLTLRLGTDKIDVDSILLQRDAECEKIFSLDSTMKYVPNSNMACGLDDTDKGTVALSGAPLADVALTDGKHALHGIRSVASLDPGHRNGFLVTRIAPNCNWLFRASEGAVKCV